MILRHLVIAGGVTLAAWFLSVAAVAQPSSQAVSHGSKTADAKPIRSTVDSGYYGALPGWKPVAAAAFPRDPFIKQDVLNKPASGVPAGQAARDLVRKDDTVQNMKAFFEEHPVTAVAFGSTPMIVLGGEIFLAGEFIEFPDAGGKMTGGKNGAKGLSGKLKLKQVTDDGVLVFEMSDKSGGNAVEFRQELRDDLKDLMY